MDTPFIDPSTGKPRAWIEGQPTDATHYHEDCKWAVASLLKCENDEWYAWHGDNREGQWAPVSYPEWIAVKRC